MAHHCHARQVVLNIFLLGKTAFTFHSGWFYLMKCQVFFFWKQFSVDGIIDLWSTQKICSQRRHCSIFDLTEFKVFLDILIVENEWAKTDLKLHFGRELNYYKKFSDWRIVWDNEAVEGNGRWKTSQWNWARWGCCMGQSTWGWGASLRQSGPKGLWRA